MSLAQPSVLTIKRITVLLFFPWGKTDAVSVMRCLLLSPAATSTAKQLSSNLFPGQTSCEMGTVHPEAGGWLALECLGVGWRGRWRERDAGSSSSLPTWPYAIELDMGTRHLEWGSQRRKEKSEGHKCAAESSSSWGIHPSPLTDQRLRKIAPGMKCMKAS